MFLFYLLVYLPGCFDCLLRMRLFGGDGLLLLMITLFALFGWCLVLCGCIRFGLIICVVLLIWIGGCCMFILVGGH